MCNDRDILGVGVLFISFDTVDFWVDSVEKFTVLILGGFLIRFVGYFFVLGLFL